MSQVYRINWRPDRDRKTPFCYVEAPHATITDFVTALDGGLVPCHELYFDRSQSNRWKLTHKVEFAIRGDEVLSVMPASRHVLEAMDRRAG